MAEKPAIKDYYGSPPDDSRVPKPDPNDVSSIEGIIRASYETISGPAGKPREWERMRSLFLPESHQIRTGPLGDRIGYKLMTSEQFVELMNDWLVENGFF